MPTVLSGVYPPARATTERRATVGAAARAATEAVTVKADMA